LAALVAAQAGQLSEQATLIEAMRVELAALRRQAGRDSSNSSQPPSQDGPGAEAKARAEKRTQGAGEAGTTAKKRKQGGQRGHRGSGLARVADPKHTKPVEPAACGGCGAGLAGAPGDVGYSVQVFDLPSFSLEVTEYLMMRRVCGCGHPTTADAPSQVRGGPTCYGPQVAAATAWLASQDVIGIERAADMMAALLGAPVSTGYVSSCLTRLDTALTTAGFEEELKGALREQDVLGTDETPAPLTATGVAAETGEDCSNPQVFTVRTLRAYTRGWAGDPIEDLAGDLVWYGAAGTRTKKAITSFSILETFCGALVRDDFGGYVSYDPQLAGVQQCVSHLLRYLDDAYDIDPATQMWARQVADALRTAIHAVNTARRNGASLDPDVIAAARRSYDKGVAVGISTNLSRPLAQAQPPRPGAGETVAAQGQTGVAVHHPPARRPAHEQRIGSRHPWLQAGRKGPRLLAQPDHSAPPLPDPLLHRQRPQPRPPTHRRHPRRLHRHPLDATTTRHHGDRPRRLMLSEVPLSAYARRGQAGPWAGSIC
jgi:transposase